MTRSDALDDVIFLTSMTCALLVRAVAAAAFGILCCVYAVRAVAAVGLEKLAAASTPATVAPFDRH